MVWCGRWSAAEHRVHRDHQIGYNVLVYQQLYKALAEQHEMVLLYTKCEYKNEIAWARAVVHFSLFLLTSHFFLLTAS
jgi:hypothetical protein